MLGRENENRAAHLQDFAAILGHLPLDSCTFEQNPITAERGWKAPEGKAFQITGQFILDSDQLDITDWIGPNYSAELFKAKYPQDFQNCWEEAEGDEEYAWELFIGEKEAEGMPARAPHSFTGKWLVIRPEPGGTSFSDKDALPEVHIKADIEAWYEQEFLQSINDLNPTSDIVTSCLFHTVKAVAKWQQLDACAEIGHSQIVLVDFQEVKKSLHLPKAEQKDLLLPGKNDLWVDTTKRVREAETNSKIVFKEAKGFNYLQHKLGLIVALRRTNAVKPTKDEVKKINL